MAEGRRDKFDSGSMKEINGVDISDISWADESLCKGADINVFFPERGETTAKARKICKQCVVIEECATEAVFLPERFGVHAGLTPAELDNVRHYLTDGVTWDFMLKAVLKARDDGFATKNEARKKGTLTPQGHIDAAAGEFFLSEE